MTDSEKLLNLESIKNEINKAQEHYPTCDCENVEIRARHFGTGVHYVNQCLQCGEQRGSSIKREVALSNQSISKILPFDPQIKEAWNTRKQSYTETIRAMEARYNQLYTDIFGENTNTALQLREIAKANLKEAIELLEESQGIEQAIMLLTKGLSSIKRKKISILRENTDRFQSEDELKKWFISNFSQDFFIKPEVKGIHLAEQINVRIDFLLQAKPHLINNGFTSELFGIEVKYLSQENGFTRKASRSLWQTISYNDSQFDTKNGYCKPKFCLLFSNLSFENEIKLLNDDYYESDHLVWRAMIHVANHARVGQFKIRGTKNNFLGWNIVFSDTTYFSCRKVNSDFEYRKSKEDLIHKVRVGSF